MRVRRFFTTALAASGIGKALGILPDNNTALNASRVEDLLFQRTPGLRNPLGDTTIEMLEQLPTLPNSSGFSLLTDQEYSGSLSYRADNGKWVNAQNVSACRRETKARLEQMANSQHKTYVTSGKFSLTQLKVIEEVIETLKKLVDPKKLNISFGGELTDSEISILQDNQRVKQIDTGCAIIKFTEDTPPIPIDAKELPDGVNGIAAATDRTDTDKDKQGNMLYIDINKMDNMEEFFITVMHEVLHTVGSDHCPKKAD